ncbi:MAG: sn-glycerol-3-phosphate ABC transporter ATP-binding protein UgpC [Rhizobiales bacterium]|nr:sn-glycerol-3-phosphate ABC transporter ATP-binding protein UgpC [Hyphomicrobiales bacterium]
MADVKIGNLHKSYGTVEVLKDINLQVEDGAFVVLVGPSGCGKSTLLRSIAGLEPITSGAISIGGRNVSDLAPAQREIAMVFQSYALYPHMNVENNMAFGLKFAGVPKAEIADRVNEAARILQLEPLLKRRPRELSGGQRQRVAIGRAIVRHPKVFLFDEPLSNLDAALRINTRVEIARLHKLLKATIVYVTHDQVEAMTLADKIVVMNKGRVEQVGKPLELYYRPANLFVARFIGSPAMNTLAATLDGKGKAAAVAGVSLPLPAAVSGTGEITIGFRPEHCSIGKTGIPARVELVERLGETGYVHARTADGAALLVEVKGDPGLAQGAEVRVAPAAGHLHLFDGEGVRLAGT